LAEIYHEPVELSLNSNIGCTIWGTWSTFDRLSHYWIFAFEDAATGILLPADKKF
jgi:hypothetical protein